MELQDRLEAHLQSMLDESERRRRTARERYADPQRHCVLSHLDWERHARAADIPRVATHHLGTLKLQSMLDAWDDEGEPRRAMTALGRRLDEAADALEQRLGTPVVVRTDYCAPEAVKATCAMGRTHADIAGAAARYANPVYACMRTAELAGDWPREDLAVLARPYVAPRMEGRYPVELRVWIRDGAVRAISNYYPQRTLPESRDTLKAIAEATRYAERLANRVTPFDPIPMDPSLPEQVTFTADFLVAQSGTTLWLECGPYTFPHWGSHPCCITALDVLWKKETSAEPHIALAAVAKYQSNPAESDTENP